MTIKTRIHIITLTAFVIIIAPITIYINYFAQSDLEEKLYHEMELVGSLFEAKVRARQRGVEEIVQSTALIINKTPQLVPFTQVPYIYEIVKGNAKELFGMCVAINPAVQRYAGFVYWNGDSVVFKDLSLVPGYHYEIQPWFLSNVINFKAGWSTYYNDAGGGDVLMATYSVPIFNKENHVQAILTGDLNLEWLTNDLNSIILDHENQLAIVTDRNTGQILVAPDTVVMAIQIDSLNLKNNKENDTDNWKTKVGNSNFYVVSRSSSEHNWKVNIIYSDSIIKMQLRQYNLMLFYFSILLIIIILCFSAWASKSITNPLKDIVKTAEDVGQGKQITEFKHLNRKDELGQLTRAMKRIFEIISPKKNDKDT